MRKESYERKQVVHFTVRRFLNQTIHMGREGEPLQEYNLPYRNILPIPIFVPRDVTQPDVTREPSPSRIKSTMDSETSLNGLCLQKREVSSITKHKPMVIQPRSPDFRASSLISPPRDTLGFQRWEWWADESCLPSWTRIQWQVWWVTSRILKYQSRQETYMLTICFHLRPPEKPYQRTIPQKKLMSWYLTICFIIWNIIIVLYVFIYNKCHLTLFIF